MKQRRRNGVVDGQTDVETHQLAGAIQDSNVKLLSPWKEGLLSEAKTNTLNGLIPESEIPEISHWRRVWGTLLPSTTLTPPNPHAPFKTRLRILLHYLLWLLSCYQDEKINTKQTEKAVTVKAANLPRHPGRLPWGTCTPPIFCVCGSSTGNTN